MTNGKPVGHFPFISVRDVPISIGVDVKEGPENMLRLLLAIVRQCYALEADADAGEHLVPVHVHVEIV